MSGSSAQNAVRWYEITANLRTVPVTSLNVFQQGTYEGTAGRCPVALDGFADPDNKHDILVGYSESSSSTHPAIYVAGRKSGRSAGPTLRGSALGPGQRLAADTANRWGDYSTMAIDPSDNCTFFYTTEYYMVTQQFDWSTDISRWNFPTCH